MIDSNAIGPHGRSSGPSRSRLLPTLALVSGLLLAPAFASAQEARKAAIADTATITAIDPEQRRITVGETGETRRIQIEDTTQILVGGERVTLSALEVGDRIAVTASEEGAEPTGLPIANEIEVVIEETAVSAGAQATPHSGEAPSGTGDERTVALRDAQGQPVGEARIVDSPNGILIHAAFHDLPAGEHGFHIHETGRCEPTFDAAGDHLAKEDRQHGLLREGGPHAGDLVNLQVASDGRVAAVVRAPALRLADLEDGDGSALVIHAQPDDYRSQPSGAAGDRIACGVIGAGKSRPSATP